ncbi:NADPH:quinone reductase [Actinacidiphila alni]|uniref:NADPH:quinone reductase n=2 Tax=Actinacidiphila alni TaxID=380248 RepID=A0A1I2MTC2_9ACTN|nr:NADP-dependent oxidoreductase [Actinacidiphila alni]SFF94784.1 NADPH:quinone reductase [Actinacidiphila alni]
MEVGEAPEPQAGPGTVRIAVRASGFTPADAYVRSGRLKDMMAIGFPYRTGFDAAGVVDQVAEGVTDTAVGDEVFGMTTTRARGANSDSAVLTSWARKPAAWSWPEAGGAAGSVETSTRVLDRLRVGASDTVLVQGAAGAVGTVAVQLAAARGARVIGTASEHNHDFLRSMGATPTTYGEGIVERVRALAPDGVDAVFDCAGGSLPDLITIAGDATRVVTIADFMNAAAYNVHLSHGAPADEEGKTIGPAADPLAVHGLALAAELADRGKLRIPIAGAFLLEDASAAHELSESGHARGKIVFLNE